MNYKKIIFSSIFFVLCFFILILFWSTIQNLTKGMLGLGLFLAVAWIEEEVNYTKIEK